ncbi:MAG: PTS transporter subunit EIIB [Selenomonadaceae bacterium]
MTHTELAAKILEVCNGSSNISKHTNCMTRLRLHLINQPPSIIDSLSKISGVAGVNQQGE